MDYNEQCKLARETLDGLMEQLNELPKNKVPIDRKLQLLTVWYLADIAGTLIDMGKDIPACLVDIWREI